MAPQFPAERSRQHDPASGEDRVPPPEAEGAAPLTADLVRRGRNPWWGKDQPAKVPASAPAARNIREPARAAPGEPAATTRPVPVPFRRAPAPREERPRLRGPYDHGLWRDVAVFLAVFAAGSAAMLYLSLRAL